MTQTPPDSRALAAALVRTAHLAGEAALRIYATDFEVAYKGDASPVTAADHAAEAIILRDLQRLAPGIPVIAEEASAAGHAPEIGERFFLVDPLDGTKEFLKKNGEFTVNIALIEAGVPVFGLIYAPALRKLYVTLSAGEAVAGEIAAGQEPDINKLALRPLRTRAPLDGGLTCVMSRSHQNEETAAYLRRLPVAQTANIGSSLKFCLVAEGAADVYPRLGPTCEWDIAAGHAIVNAAGGCVLREDGSPLGYGKRAARYLNPNFIVWGRPETAARY